MESMGKKPRRRRSFTPEFKAEIVELCLRGDRSVGRVAKDFGLTETGRGRPQWEFDAESVFSACRDCGVAVEINCRPEHQDPPGGPLRLAVEIGCVFAIDTDAHAPGQLDWLEGGCGRAELVDIGPDRVINTRIPPS
jgi:histidinol phosphatase-like PHP family hydrolase